MNINNSTSLTEFNVQEVRFVNCQTFDEDEELKNPNIEYEKQLLNTAKSIFSKKQRILYHWMNPNLSKSQAKNMISTAWDNIGLEEKQFYINQAMGPMGIISNAQTNLMVNPQLLNKKIMVDPLLNINIDQSNLVANPQLNNKSVSNINSIEGHEALKVENDNWVQSAPLNLVPVKRKRGRPPTREIKRLNTTAVNPKRNPRKSLLLKKMENPEEDFPDDPELKGEFEKFQTALNFNFKNKIEDFV